MVATVASRVAIGEYWERVVLSPRATRAASGVKIRFVSSHPVLRVPAEDVPAISSPLALIYPLPPSSFPALIPPTTLITLTLTTPPRRCLFSFSLDLPRTPLSSQRQPRSTIGVLDALPLPPHEDAPPSSPCSSEGPQMKDPHEMREADPACRCTASKSASLSPSSAQDRPSRSVRLVTCLVGVSAHLPLPPSASASATMASTSTSGDSSNCAATPRTSYVIPFFAVQQNPPSLLPFSDSFCAARRSLEAFFCFFCAGIDVDFARMH
ncbi:hypothetical protein MSAN_00518600 [Mycena sanguinolenta]|uniref:Uncharacterized protein n=1 Tax=Mycena sanguinolenta TaxID=230812 RepID=A0A8H7DI44_9AGAR|nr:hypothetical protein MSAN_00518600 [Mycena sanguinolenta]